MTIPDPIISMLLGLLSIAVVGLVRGYIRHDNKLVELDNRLVHEDKIRAIVTRETDMLSQEQQRTRTELKQDISDIKTTIDRDAEGVRAALDYLKDQFAKGLRPDYDDYSSKRNGS